MSEQQKHQQMNIGRYTLYRHDYDGPMVQVVDYNARPEPTQFALHESVIEVFLSEVRATKGVPV